MFLLPVTAYSDELSLKAGPNRELLIQNCLACHSERLITQNHMERKAWDEKITWMQQNHNLWPLANDVREKILDYLASFQGVQNLNTVDPMDNLGPRNVNALPL